MLDPSLGKISVISVPLYRKALPSLYIPANPFTSEEILITGLLGPPTVIAGVVEFCHRTAEPSDLIAANPFPDS
jgi:hypothetical protein